MREKKGANPSIQNTGDGPYGMVVVFLAYSLIRLKMLHSGIDGWRDPRSMSFSRTLVLLGTTWVLCAACRINDSLIVLGKNQLLDE
jgi:hypothetical protein